MDIDHQGASQVATYLGIAIPAVTGDNGTLAELIAALQDLVLLIGADLDHQHAEQPAIGGLFGGVAADVGVLIVGVGRERLLIEAGVGALVVIGIT